MKKNLPLDPTEEFLKAMREYVPEEIAEEYRAYYDDSGQVHYITTGPFDDKNLNWILVSREFYNQHRPTVRMRVVNGKIVEIIPTNNYYFPLIRSNKGVKVVKAHAGIVVESGDNWNEVEYYDRRNS